MSATRRAFRRSTALAMALTLLTSQSVAGVTWGAAVVISLSGGAFAVPRTVEVTGTQRVHVMYTENPGSSADVVYRQSTDGGSTWGTAMVLSHLDVYGAYAGALDHSGTALDAVWAEFDSSDNFQLWYRRSIDNGAHWDARMQLTPAVYDAGQPDIARAGNRVTVAWTDGSTGKVYVRISTDGGVSFAAKIQVGATVNQPYQGLASYDGFPSVVDSSGTITVVWDSSAAVIQTRRSTNAGTSWSTPVTLATNANGRLTNMAAAGEKVIVGYTSAVGGYWHATQRRSLNEGGTWKPADVVGGNGTFTPVFGTGGGTLRVVFLKCEVSDCSTTVVMFRTSTDFGATWSAASQASRASHVPITYPVGVGPIANGQSVVIYGRVNASDEGFLYARKTI